jgi:hypothetical protein
MKTCEDCKYIQGNECIRYTGPQNDACGLIPGSWYTVDQLIAALLCASQATGSGGSCDNCICLLVVGTNQSSIRAGGNVQATLSYRLYSDPEHANQIISREVANGAVNTFNVKGTLPYDKVYPVISAVFSKQDEDQPYFTSGYGVDMVLVTGDKLLYARSMVQPTEGEHVFEGIPGQLPTGEIHIYLLTNQFDTNTDAGAGVIAVGGDAITASEFNININLEGGGTIDRPNLSWPPATEGISADFDFTNYDVSYYGTSPSSINITITGQNNEGVPVTVSFEASADSTLSFTEQIAAGAIYQKVVPITTLQAYNNDFLILFTKLS